jgi:hypothetical protein
MNNIQAIIGNVDQVIASARPVFAAYIKDTSISLDERWQAFTAANDALKDHQRFQADLTLGREQISWYDDFCIDRYTTVKTEWLVESLYEVGDHTPDIIAEFKEQILQQNLGSFTFDW